MNNHEAKGKQKGNKEEKEKLIKRETNFHNENALSSIGFRKMGKDFRFRSSGTVKFKFLLYYALRSNLEPIFSLIFRKTYEEQN